LNQPEKVKEFIESIKKMGDQRNGEA